MSSHERRDSEAPIRLVAPERLWLDGGLRTGLVAEIDDGAVRAVRPLATDDVPDLRPYLLMPAATDLQVNGSGGVMLNSEPTPQGISAIVAAQRRRGTGWVLPTLITTTDAVMERAADAAIEAWGLPGFLGLHLEGPHMNPARKGTHDVSLFRPLGEATMAILRRLRDHGIPVMLTLAPETVPAERIAAIADLGVVLSAGHTAATADEAKAGVAAGVSCYTHLFNAMPPMLSREPGVVAAAINGDAFIGIIADGHHVAWDMIAIAARARPMPGRLFLVSDAMSTIGGPDHFELYGERIEVRNGALVNANGSLAGAHIDMLTSLRNLVHRVGLPLEDAVAMATDVPQRAMRLVPPSLDAGLAPAEVVALDGNLMPLPLD